MAPQKKIAFLCFDTAFFVRHFRPAVDAARASGFSIIALLPKPSDESVDFLDGVEIIHIKVGRGRRPILSLLFNLFSIVSSLRACRPDVVQAFTVHACFILSLASRLISIPYRIYTITGLGLLEIDSRWTHRILRPLVYWTLRSADSDFTIFVFENATDPIRLGFRHGRPRRNVTLMGAGVDVESFSPRPLPTLPPLKAAIVARMIWSKGIDLAVEAVSRLVEQGVAVELDIYGAPDLDNQRHFSAQVLEGWGRRRGIRCHGQVSDICEVWQNHHIGLFPSRGGEGLPRAMLEAAACGRALIATTVAGCADFVRADIEGLLVKPNSVEALSRAIETFVKHPDLLQPMGQAARQRVIANSTVQIITSRYRSLFSQL
jgi:glycosyltransferase involved in cell wall biosynthesis